MREVRPATKELSAVHSTELTSRRKILEKWRIKISSKSTAGFFVAPRSLADSMHSCKVNQRHCENMENKIVYIHMEVTWVMDFLAQSSNLSYKVSY